MPKTLKRSKKLTGSKRIESLKYLTAAGWLEEDQPAGVQLTYQGTEVKCVVCGTNRYSKVDATLPKSKARNFVGQMFLGDVAEIFDTTSVVVYACVNCGMCRMVMANAYTQVVPVRRY